MSKATQMAKQTSLEKIQKVQELTNPPRISETEKKHIQTVFGMDAPIYTALRDCFYGFVLTDDQKTELARIKPVAHLIRRIFLPEISRELPFGQNYDLWQTQDMKTATPDIFPYIYKAKVQIIGMLTKSLARLDNPDLDGVSLEPQDDFALLLARNGYVSYVDSQIRFLMQFAIQNNLTDQEMKAILQMNSSK